MPERRVHSNTVVVATMAFCAGLVFGAILSMDTLATYRADVMRLKEGHAKLAKEQEDTAAILTDMLDRPWRWWDTKGKKR